MDAIPVLSQLKSLVQVIFKDREEAELTQINFSRRCLIVSQIRSAVEASLGDCKAAEATQMECAGFLQSVVEGTPVVGHAVGAGYYAAGYKNRGDCAMKSASRTTGVIGGGIIGFFVGGPLGATTGGSIGGLTMDGVTTGVESVIQKKFVPHGVLIPFAEPKNPGKWADSVFTLLLDSLLGRASGSVIGKIIQPKSSASVIVASEEIIPRKLTPFTVSKSSIPVPVVELSTVTAVVGKELRKIYNTKYGATVKKHGDQILESMTKYFSYEFHELLNPKPNSNIPLKSSKVKQLKKNLLKSPIRDRKQEAGRTMEVNNALPSVLSVKEFQFKGSKCYIINSTTMETLAESQNSEKIVESQRLRRSLSCYF